MQRLEVSGAVRPIYGSLGFKRLTYCEGMSVALGIQHAMRMRRIDTGALSGRTTFFCIIS